MDVVIKKSLTQCLYEGKMFSVNTGLVQPNKIILFGVEYLQEKTDQER